LFLGHRRGDGLGIRLLFGHVPSLALQGALDYEGDIPDGDGGVPTAWEQRDAAPDLVRVEWTI
jgi:hypothetical protein